MTTTQLIRYRLRAQHLVPPYFTKPVDVVEWMGAVQAQDYLGALWSVGQRLKKSVEADVEEAIAKKEIVRTWPMRGTLHFVAPKDSRWMLQYLTPRVFARIASVLRKDEIDEKVLAKSTKALVRALEGGNRLTRPELYGALERAKISTSGTRGLHIIVCVAQRGVICFGPRQDKQHTFVLLDEWLPSFPVLPREEAMAELAIRYFKSHGPATADDFMWWAGLTKSGALESIRAAGRSLTETQVGDNTYWLAPDAKPASSAKGIRLLPTYDEYGIGYKDRSTIISRTNVQKVEGGYTSAVIDDGKAIGLWRRTTGKDTVKVDVAPLNRFTKDQRAGIEAEAARYAKFTGKNVEVLKFR
ncbi:MAG TPA: winged helix DNA-binding domain-containing protein [Cyclobacteriaceae bacterium]|nr:winged helix DNA-binding domain-containing protein [Cyclobacteriaceae bacterium]